MFKIEKINIKSIVTKEYRDDNLITITAKFDNFIIRSRNNRLSILLDDLDSFRRSEDSDFTLYFYINIKTGKFSAIRCNTGRSTPIVGLVKDMNKNYQPSRSGTFTITNIFEEVENFSKIMAMTFREILEKRNITGFDPTAISSIDEVLDDKSFDKQYIYSDELEKESSRIVFKFDRNFMENCKLEDSTIQRKIESDLFNILLDKALDDGDEEIFMIISKELGKIKIKK